MIKADLKQQPYEHYLGILSNSCEKPITKTYVQPKKKTLDTHNDTI